MVDGSLMEFYRGGVIATYSMEGEPSSLHVLSSGPTDVTDIVLFNRHNVAFVQGTTVWVADVSYRREWPSVRFDDISAYGIAYDGEGMLMQTPKCVLHVTRSHQVTMIPMIPLVTPKKSMVRWLDKEMVSWNAADHVFRRRVGMPDEYSVLIPAENDIVTNASGAKIWAWDATTQTLTRLTVEKDGVQRGEIIPIASSTMAIRWTKKGAVHVVFDHGMAIREIS
jgi:hypothetical protein